MCLETGAPFRGARVFRHTFATNRYCKGIEVKILSKLLGQIDVKVIYNTYIDLYPEAGSLHTQFKLDSAVFIPLLLRTE